LHFSWLGDGRAEEIDLNRILWQKRTTISFSGNCKLTISKAIMT
jgi:hypothetical protein